MFRVFALPACLALGFALPAQADEVTDALNSAIEAYDAGDIAYAIEELDYAKQLLAGMKTDALIGFLPQAPDGWTREVNTDMSAGLAMMGGGTGAEAEYSVNGQSFTISVMADNPMVAGMGAMIGSAAAIGAKLERVGRQKFMVQNGELTGLVDNRILVQAKGGEVETMLDLLKTMDFKALSNFGR